MDSMMIEFNIRKMGRLKLLYSCLSKLVKEPHRDGKVELLDGQEHYAESVDRNRVVYHEKDIPKADRLQKVINDAMQFLPKRAEEHADSEGYGLLERAILEQTKKDDDGWIIPKGKGGEMDSSSFQNPFDPDATYRQKAGKDHRGYSKKSWKPWTKTDHFTDHQYDVNIRSDVDFLRESIENTERFGDATKVITGTRIYPA